MWPTATIIIHMFNSTRNLNDLAKVIHLERHRMTITINILLWLRTTVNIHTQHGVGGFDFLLRRALVALEAHSHSLKLKQSRAVQFTYSLIELRAHHSSGTYMHDLHMMRLQLTAFCAQHKKICTQLKPLSLRRKCFCKDVDCWLWSYHDWKMYFSNHRGVFTNDRLANHSPNRVHTLQIHLCTTKIPRRCNPQIERYNHLINDRGFSINGMKAFFLHFFAA